MKIDDLAENNGKIKIHNIFPADQDVVLITSTPIRTFEKITVQPDEFIWNKIVE
jgi:hypothetical protein